MCIPQMSGDIKISTDYNLGASGLRLVGQCTGLPLILRYIKYKYLFVYQFR